MKFLIFNFFILLTFILPSRIFDCCSRVSLELGARCNISRHCIILLVINGFLLSGVTFFNPFVVLISTDRLAFNSYCYFLVFDL